MSQEIKVTGMVLQAGNIGEYDKRIVLLTKERGRISAFARGAKKATSQYAAACQPFTFGEFSLYEGKNSFNLMWAGVENYFDTLKKDLDLIYYASYFCELASYLTRENNDELEILKLLYQTLRALEKKTINIELVRCIYEIKILALYGIGIEASRCVKCGSREDLIWFDARESGVFVLPPREKADADLDVYRGTADAISQNIDFIDKYSPEYLLVLSGDHIYKMDYAAMLKFHESMESDCTIAVRDVPLKEASRFGIMNTREDGSIYEFEEKPKHPKSTNASMGI